MRSASAGNEESWQNSQFKHANYHTSPCRCARTNVTDGRPPQKVGHGGESGQPKDRSDGFCRKHCVWMSQSREIPWCDDGIGDGNEQGKHSREDVEDDSAWNMNFRAMRVEDVRNCFVISMMGREERSTNQSLPRPWL